MSSDKPGSIFLFSDPYNGKVTVDHIFYPYCEEKNSLIMSSFLRSIFVIEPPTMKYESKTGQGRGKASNLKNK